MNVPPSTLLKSYFYRLMDDSYSFSCLKIMNKKELELCTALKMLDVLCLTFGVSFTFYYMNIEKRSKLTVDEFFTLTYSYFLFITQCFDWI